MFDISPVSLLLVLSLGSICGYLAHLFLDKRKLSSVRIKADEIMKEAHKEIKANSKEALLEGRDQILKEKKEIEQELREQRKELNAIERRLFKREESIDTNIKQKDNELTKREKGILDIEAKANLRIEELDSHKKDYLSKLELLASYTREQAKEILINNIRHEAELEAQKYVSKIEQESKLTAADEAKKTIITTIQRLAPEISQEASVSSVALPSNDMKGRIIGREGRNIRILELLTGVDIIIDDTPETIVLSCFDPVRREKARETITKLIADGRIHPTKIEEIFNRVSDEIDKSIREEGDRTCLELGMRNMSSELKEYVGKLKYRYSYGQNILNHSKQVAHISAYIAAETGANKALSMRGGLLHDIGKSVHTEDGDHASTGAQIAKKYGEHEIVINAIASHHFDVEPKYLESIIVQTADAISAARPGARRASFNDYVTRLTNLEAIAYSFSGVEKAFAVQAGRELRIIVNNNTTDDDGAKKVARDIATKIETEMKYPGQVKVSLIRETRVTEYAR